jgi:hypothetical protein
VYIYIYIYTWKYHKETIFYIYIYTWKYHKETPCCHFFFFLSFENSENGRVEWVLPREVDTNGRGKEVGKGCRRVSMVQILCTHVCKWKNVSVETTPGMGRGDKGEWWKE